MHKPRSGGQRGLKLREVRYLVSEGVEAPGQSRHCPGPGLREKGLKVKGSPSGTGLAQGEELGPGAPGR